MSRAVRNLITMHSLVLVSRYRAVAATRREAGRYDVLQPVKITELAADRTACTINSLRVVCVIDLEDSESGIIQDILNGLEDE